MSGLKGDAPVGNGTYQPRYYWGPRPPIAPLKLPRLKKGKPFEKEKEKEPLKPPPKPTPEPKPEEAEGTPEREGPPYPRPPAPTRPAVEARLGAGKDVVPTNPNLNERQWVRVERVDRPNPNAHPMPVSRTALPGGHRTPVMPHPSDAAVNREPGQMTLFPDMPHSQPRDVPDLGMHGPHPEPYTGGYVAQPGGIGQDQPEGTQGYLFRDKTDKEQARSAVAKSRQKSQKAWEDS